MSWVKLCSVCVCVCVCVCVFVCACVRACVRACVCIHVSVRAQVRVFMCVYAGVNITLTRPCGVATFTTLNTPVLQKVPFERLYMTQVAATISTHNTPVLQNICPIVGGCTPVPGAFASLLSFVSSFHGASSEAHACAED